MLLNRTDKNVCNIFEKFIRREMMQNLHRMDFLNATYKGNIVSQRARFRERIYVFSDDSLSVEFSRVGYGIALKLYINGKVFFYVGNKAFLIDKDGTSCYYDIDGNLISYDEFKILSGQV